MRGKHILKNIAVIGSTGSIGTQAIDIIEAYPERFRAVALTCGCNIELLVQQANRLKPDLVGIADKNKYKLLKKLINYDCQIVCGDDANEAALSKADTSLISAVGFSGFKPLVKSIELGIRTCVANKESIVCGGAAISKLLKEKNAVLYPVDSEHSAIFQCLEGNKNRKVRRIILTCSGGPFRTWSYDRIKKATKEDALKHPNWKMGKKITIDSATLANKGLEVLEARWLFNMPIDKIEVVIHPQSIIHSMVEYSDCSVLAQLGWPDMKLPIQFALGYPERLQPIGKPLDLTAFELTFEKPDISRFPALELAYTAGKMSGTAPVAYSAANDVAVNLFLEDKIPIYGIPELIQKAVDKFGGGSEPGIEDIIETDTSVRQWLKEFI